MKRSIVGLALAPALFVTLAASHQGLLVPEAEAQSAPETYTGAVKCENPEVKAAVVQYLGTGAGIPSSVKPYTSLSDAKRPWKVSGGAYKLDVPTSAFWRTLTSFPSTQRGPLRIELSQNHGSNGAVAHVNIAFCQFHRSKAVADWGKVRWDDVSLTGSKYFKYPKGGTGIWALEMPDTTRSDVDDARAVVAVFDVGGITNASTLSFNVSLAKP